MITEICFTKHTDVVRLKRNKLKNILDNLK